jgi:protein-S-isoprenylcysteine O-methyltransferase Ste14
MTGYIVFGVIVLVVLVTSLIKTVDMSEKTKNIIAAVVSVLAGVFINLSIHAFDFGSYAVADILGTILVVYGGAQAVYQFILNGTGLDAKLEALTLKPKPNDPEGPDGF